MVSAQKSNFRQQIQAWGPGLLALGVLLLIYGWTLQKDINGSSHDYLLDTGEIQVALNLWGTIHYTGYPLYILSSSPLTHLLHGAGLSPAAAASATSLIWSLLGLSLFYRVLCYIVAGNTILSGLAVMALGLVETFWLHSIIAEVYSFSLWLISLAFLLALRLQKEWQPTKWLAVVFVLGTAVAHHRLLLLILPIVGLLIGFPAWLWLKQGLKNIIHSLLAFLAPFLVYIYLPLRAWQKATWVYGQPQTWAGFWQQFTGSEVTSGLLRLPSNIQVLVDNWHFLSDHLTRQMPWMFLTVGLLGLIWLTYKHPQKGLAWLYGAVVFPFLVLIFPKAVWIPAVLMPTLLCIIIGIVWLLHQLATARPNFRPISWIGLLFLAMFLFRVNLPFITQLTHDPHGRQIIRLFQAIPTDQFPGKNPVVTLPWGTSFFAAAYGLYVVEELPELTLVDHRANFKEILADRGSILTPGFFLPYWPPTWWQELLGPVRFDAVTPGVIAISQQRPFQNVPPTTNFDLGNGIQIRSVNHTITHDTVQLQVYWEATEIITQTYGVAIHLVTQFPPTGPDDIVAQADAAHPVQSWYPTTQWTVGEIVLDQYELILPTETCPSAIAITMYQVNDAGQFENSEWFVIDLEDGRCG